jgi:hypothetical protein
MRDYVIYWSQAAAVTAAIWADVKLDDNVKNPHQTIKEFKRSGSFTLFAIFFIPFNHNCKLDFIGYASFGRKTFGRQAA